MVNPCCISSLQKSVKIVAVVSLMFTIFLITLEIFMISKYGFTIEADFDADQEFPFSEFSDDIKNTTKVTKVTNSSRNQSITPENVIKLFTIGTGQFKWITGFWFASWVLDIFLSIILYIGAQKRDETKCLIWFYIRCTLLFFRVMFLIMYILAGITLIRKIPVIISFLFRGYCLWVVSSFIHELREDRKRETDASYDNDPNVSRLSLQKSSLELVNERGKKKGINKFFS